VEETRWAGPILEGLGFKYSSSIFPIRHRRYGISTEARPIHRWQGSRLIECPPACLRAFGMNWPVAGGGYFRLLPSWMVRRAVGRLNRQRMPAILYMHPYELDPGGVGAHRESGVRVGRVREVTQEMFRGRMERRLHRLFESFRFTTMRDLLRHAN
jgi:Domain of unknown function (DUF3473)